MHARTRTTTSTASTHEHAQACISMHEHEGACTNAHKHSTAGVGPAELEFGRGSWPNITMKRLARSALTFPGRLINKPRHPNPISRHRKPPYKGAEDTPSTSLPQALKHPRHLRHSSSSSRSRGFQICKAVKGRQHRGLRCRDLEGSTPRI